MRNAPDGSVRPVPTSRPAAVRRLDGEPATGGHQPARARPGAGPARRTTRSRGARRRRTRPRADRRRPAGPGVAVRESVTGTAPGVTGTRTSRGVGRGAGDHRPPARGGLQRPVPRQPRPAGPPPRGRGRTGRRRGPGGRRPRAARGCPPAATDRGHAGEHGPPGNGDLHRPDGRDVEGAPEPRDRVEDDADHATGQPGEGDLARGEHRGRPQGPEGDVGTALRRAGPHLEAAPQLRRARRDGQRLRARRDQEAAGETRVVSNRSSADAPLGQRQPAAAPPVRTASIRPGRRRSRRWAARPAGARAGRRGSRWAARSARAGRRRARSRRPARGRRRATERAGRGGRTEAPGRVGCGGHDRGEPHGGRRRPGRRRRGRDVHRRGGRPPGPARHGQGADARPTTRATAVIAAVLAALGRAGLGPPTWPASRHGMTVGTNALLEGTGAPHRPRGHRGVRRPAGAAAPDARAPLPPRRPPPAPARARTSAPTRCASASRPGGRARRRSTRRPWRGAVAAVRADGRRGRGRRPAVLVRPPGPRAAGGRRAARRAARRARERLQRGAPRDPGVRAALDHRGRRLPDPGAAPATCAAWPSGPQAAGLPAPAIMQSSGGVLPIDAAAEHAAWTVLSGPAAA